MEMEEKRAEGRKVKVRTLIVKSGVCYSWRIMCVVFRSTDIACNGTLYVNSSAAVSLYMTSSSSSDVISRYPSSHCLLYIAAGRGQRLSFTVFTLGGPSEATVDDGMSWDEQVTGGGSAQRPCDARRTLYIVDDGRTASSSLCRLPRFQSRHRLVYTSRDWRVAVYWTWTTWTNSDHWTQPDTSLDNDIYPFTSYILNVEGQLHTCTFQKQFMI